MTVQTFVIEGAGRRVAMKMDIDLSFSADAWLWEALNNRSCYEPDIAWLLLRTLKPGDVAVDVGANVGFFTLLMAHLVGQTGEVYSFEPGANNIPKLCVNIDCNAETAVGRLRVITEPLWSTKQLKRFYLSSDDSGGNALWDPAAWPANTKTRECGKSYEVKTTTLDDVFYRHNHERIRVIKIDTEGAEEHILRGAEQLFNTIPVDYVVAELNPFGQQQLGGDEWTLRNLAVDYGFDTFLLYPDGSIPKLIPRWTKIGFSQNVNILFSTIDKVSTAWPEVGG